MERETFKFILNSIPNLGNKEFRELREGINHRIYNRRVSNLLETPFNKINCPHCDSCNFYRWGKRSDLQRYKCKDCEKTFNSLTKTPLARLRRKGHWLDYSNCLTEGLTIREAASVCGIHRNTSFRWRHRFISNLKYIKTKNLSGIIETGEIYFRESFKGKKKINKSIKYGNRKKIFILYGLDRNKNIFDVTNVKINLNNYSKNFKDIINSDSLICMEKNSTYVKFARDNNIKFGIKELNINNSNKDVIHINNFDQYKMEFKEWIINHFRGVATKYLENYVSWFRSLNEFNSGIKPLTILFRAKNIEKYRFQPLKVTDFVPV